jgi:hypothetical protein
MHSHTCLLGLGFEKLMGDLLDGAAPTETEHWVHWSRRIVVNISPGFDTEYVTENSLTDVESEELDQALRADAEELRPEVASPQ